MDKHPIQGGEAVLSVASCYRNQVKLWLCGSAVAVWVSCGCVGVLWLMCHFTLKKTGFEEERGVQQLVLSHCNHVHPIKSILKLNSWYIPFKVVFKKKSNNSH